MTVDPEGSFAPPATTVVDRLRYRAIHQADKRAFTYLADGEEEALDLTYGDLDRQARAVAAHLASLGMVGERALLLYPPGLEFIAAFFGCLYAGAVAVPAYPPRRNRNMLRIQAISVDAQAKVAMSEHSVMERVEGMLDDTPHLKQLEWVATDRLPHDVADKWVEPEIDGETKAFLQYTSGSTGTPKGVILTHTNLMHNSALIANAFESARGREGCFWLPMYHDMGLIGGIMQPMYVGGPNTLISPMAFLQKPFRWLDIISRRRITHSGGPNFAYELAARKITPEQRAKLDLSSWDLAFTGAEPVRAETIDRFCEAFGPCGFRREAFFPCYGMAEATLMVSGGVKRDLPIFMTVDGDALDAHQVLEAEPEEDAARTIVGCGGNLPDQEILIVDPETLRPLPPESVGEIWVAGPSIAKGYWKKPDLTREAFEARLDGSGKGPYLRTGDLGFMWEGELFVTGRLKDLIIIRGVNRYPQDIEATVQAAHPWLRPDAGAVVVADVAGSERLIVVNEVNRARGKKFDEVFAAIRREVAAEHELPVDAIVLIRARTIPKTSSGKIQRHACARDFLDGSLSILASSCGWESVKERAVPAGKAPPETPPVAETPSPAQQAAATEAAAKSSSDEPEINAEIVRVVMKLAREVAQGRARDCDLDSNITEMGLDSVEVMAIAAKLEKAYGSRFPDEILHTLHTLRDVVRAVEKHLGTIPAAERPGAGDDAAEIRPEYREFAAMPASRRARDELAQLANSGAPNPYFHIREGISGATAVINGRELTNYSSRDFLGMAGDPVVIHAAREAVERYGTSVSAGRYASGLTPLHRELEQTIASFLGVPGVLVCEGEHGANEAVIGHVMSPGDLILYDELAKEVVLRGAVLSAAERRPFPHNDCEALGQILSEVRRDYRKVLIVVQGAYEMSGDCAVLPRFVELRNAHRALLMVDEAYSLGTLGARGRGVTEHFNLEPADIDIWTGALGNSFGSSGGFVAGPDALIEYLQHSAPAFHANASLSPPNTAAALASFQLLAEQPERAARCQARARLFADLARESGLDAGEAREAPNFPVVTTDAVQALKLFGGLLDRGILATPIPFPLVRDCPCRLQLFITASHTEEQIRSTVAALAEEWSKLNTPCAKDVDGDSDVSRGDKDHASQVTSRR